MDGYVAPERGRAARLLDAAAPWVLGLVVLVLSYLARPGFGLVDLALGREPYASDVASTAGTTVVVERTAPGEDLVGFGVAAACGLAAVMARHRRWPLFVAALGGWFLFAMWPAIAVASYYVATTVRRRGEIVAYAVTASVAVLLPTAYLSTGLDNGFDRLPFGLAIFAMAVALPLMSGLWVHARRDVRGGAREWAVGRERVQAALYEQARAQERARIAREMHDVVAHRVSLMVLQAGALEVNAADPGTAQTAALIRTTGREALADLREVLGVLRSPGAQRQPQPTLADLPVLLEQSRSLGFPVERRDEGEPRPLPVTVQRTAYRILQEALTNVRKHAGPTSIRVGVRYLPDAVEVEVHNAGPGPGPEPIPGSGLGLAGLRERVELLGGRFEARPQSGGGFTVWASLPAGSVEEPE